MNDGEVVFGIDADESGLDGALKRATQSIETESEKWKQTGNSASNALMGSFDSLFKKIAGGFTAAKIAQAVFNFGKEAVNAANDLNNVQKSLEVTFGQSGHIEQWAQEAAQNFGLTEAKAKSCVAAVGEVLKTAGVTGDQLDDMSTRLVGLASDMAEFYGTDFETAFQRLQQGMNGSEEPLKAFGINMSKANLEAFALTKGIKKTFDEMTAGEQTMLRYEYLLQETADAQGEFADSSDSYAAGLRKLEAGFANLKASIGQLLIGPLNTAVELLNTLFSKLTATPQRTVLDDFAEIDITAESKLSKINETYSRAVELVGVLQELETVKPPENPGLVEFVETLSSRISGLDNAIKAAKEGNLAGAIGEISQAMESQTGIRATNWNTLLNAIINKLPKANEIAAGENASVTFLSAAAAAAKELGPEYSGMWETFLEIFGEDNVVKGLFNLTVWKTSADVLDSLGISANKLEWGTGTKWSALMLTLNTIDPTKGIFGPDAVSASYRIRALADGLTSKDPSTRKQAWQDMLGILSDNADGVSKLTGTSPDATKAWLEGLAQAAEGLDPADAVGWGLLMNTLVNGLPGLKDTQIGQAFLDDFGALKTDANALYKSSPTNWNNLLNVLNKDSNFSGGVFSGDVVGNLSTFVDKINSGTPEDRKSAWEGLLGVFGAHKDDIAAFTGQSVESVETFFQNLSEKIPDVDADLAAWDSLFTELVNFLDGSGEHGLSADFINNLETVKNTGNSLSPLSGLYWSSFLSALQKTDGLVNIFGSNADQAANNIGSLAQALSSNDVGERAQGWATLLGALADNAEAVSKLTGSDVATTKEWLDGLRESANQLDPDDAAGWVALIGELRQGLPGLKIEGLDGLGEDGYSAYFFLMMQELSRMEYAAVDAETALSALGVNTVGVADKNELWLRTCRELVTLIPSLSAIIDTETGAVKGGTAAILEHAEEFKKAKEAEVYWAAYYAKKKALAEAEGSTVTAEMELGAARKRVEALEAEAERLERKRALEASLLERYRGGPITDSDYSEGLLENIADNTEKLRLAREALAEAESTYETTVKANAEADETLAFMKQWLTEQYGDEAAAAAEARWRQEQEAASANALSKAEQDRIRATVNAATQAMKDVETYYNQVTNSVNSAVNSVVHGFDRIETATDKARATVERLDAERAAADEKQKGSFTQRISDAEAEIASVQNMTAGLESQKKFMTEYLEYLNKVKELTYTNANGEQVGLSDSLIRMLSDGSTQSFDYLRAINEELNRNHGYVSPKLLEMLRLWDEVEAKKKEMSDTLTDTQLGADAEFQKLVEAADAAVKALKLGEQAQAAMEETVGGIATGIGNKVPEVKSEVDKLCEQLERLDAYGKFGFSGGKFSFGFSGGLIISGGSDNKPEGGNAVGTTWVPRDMVMNLHEGEAVLTREEAELWRHFSTMYGGAAGGLDYNSLGDVISANSHGGGNVYLYGEVVGRILGAAQADAYRRLERSGFRK